MLNLTRMNLYRMIHTKAVVITFIVMLAFSMLDASLLIYDTMEVMDMMDSEVSLDSDMDTNSEEDVAGSDNENIDADFDDEDMNFGIYINAPISEDGSISDFIFYYLSVLNGGEVLLFMLIAAIIFFNADEKNGFIKNIAGQKSKYSIYFSKVISIAVFTLICMLGYMLFEFIVMKITFFKEYDIDIDFGLKYFPEALKILAIQYLLHVAFLCGLMMIVTITKSTAVSMVIGLLADMGFSLLASKIVQFIFHTKFDTSKYCISTSIGNVGIGAKSDTIVLALCVGIAFLIIYNLISVLWFAKRDIV